MSLTEIFEENFHFYLALGMSYDEYWYATPSLAKDYRKAYELKKKVKEQEQWLDGMYTYIAVQTALANAFRERGKSPIKFPEKPITEKEEEKSPEEIRKEVRERLVMLKESWDAGREHHQDTDAR